MGELEIGELDEIDDVDVTATDVDDLFARLRAGRTAAPDADVDVDVETASRPSDVDDEEVGRRRRRRSPDTVFSRRDEALVPLIVAGARKLKRVLADEQNEVLDTLRRREPVRELEALVPEAAAQAARYGEAITAELIAAAEAGAAAVTGEPSIDLGPTGPLAAVRESLSGGLVDGLRERLGQGVADGDGDNDAITKRVRGVYREWKTQRIDERLDDLFRLAYVRGLVEALPPETLVQWVVDPDGAPSPDCEDDALAGPTALGAAFPSGHQWPPAHPGCRCLLVVADG